MDIIPDKNLPFYRSNELLGKFIILYIFNFLFYGYLFLFGCTVMGILFYKLFFLLNGILKYIQILWFVPIIYCLVRFIVILSTTHYKWRFYRISHYRLNKRGYSENYFKYEIYEPCTRLIVKNVLYEYKLKSEYKLLKNKYLKVNQRIEDEKVRILAQVMRRNELNQTKEVVYGKSLPG
jgi:hypothetical protein